MATRYRRGLRRVYRHSARTRSSAVVCCGHINFFTSHITAAAWASAHPEITGGILSQTRALEVAEQIFGQLLHLGP